MKRIMFAIAFTMVFTGISRAGRFPADIQFLLLNDWHNGYNTTQDPSTLDKTWTPSASNVLMDEKPNSLVGRAGFILVGSTPTLQKVTNATFLAKDDGTVVYYVTDSSIVLTTKDFINYSLIISTLSTGFRPHFAKGQGYVLITNGNDTVYVSSNSNLATPLDGNNGNANAPRGRYCAYYQNNFWIGNTTSDVTAVQYSQRVSTNGGVLSILDPLAWPPSNVLPIGIGDGSAISGFDIFKVLQVHKFNNSIYSVYGQNRFNYSAVKTNAYSGASNQEAIVQLDNHEYFYGLNSVQDFDSNSTSRISDNMIPDMMAVGNNLASIKGDLWQTANDFITKGTVVGTTVSASGQLLVFTTQYINITTGIAVDNITMSGDLSTSTPWVALTTQIIDTGNLYKGWIDHITFQSAGGSQGNLFFKLRNKNAGTEAQASIQTNCNQPFPQFAMNFPSTFTVTSTDIINGNTLFKMEWDTTDARGCLTPGDQITISSVAEYGMGEITLLNTTGAYVSQITTVSSNITLWDIFNANDIFNQGNIAFFIKGATSAVNITTETFIPIAPGQIIPLPLAKNFVQWATTMTAINPGLSPAINTVSVLHNEGGSSDSSPFMFEWKKRIHLAVTTTTTGTTTLIYPKVRNTNSNPNAWNPPWTGINAKCFFKSPDNSVLYAGASTSGAIYRLDYGADDNGKTINMYWETPTIGLLNNFFEAQIWEYNLNLAGQANGTILVGTSNTGSSYADETLSINGSGEINRYLYNENRTGKYFKWRFTNNTLDEPFQLNSFLVTYLPVQIK